MNYLNLAGSSIETCTITSYELSGVQIWGVAIVAGAMVGLVLLIGWWLLEKLQDWWYDRQEEPSVADVTAEDPELVEHYVPSVDKHMQVAKELIEDVGREEIPGDEINEERDPHRKG